jgi:hypothetical protein
VRVELLYLEGCPHWETLERRLREALVSAGLDDVPIERTAVHTPAQARAVGFIGSPTLRVDGRDPFATGGEGVGLACRMFVTPAGPSGAPTRDQLVEAVRRSGHALSTGTTDAVP